MFSLSLDFIDIFCCLAFGSVCRGVMLLLYHLNEIRLHHKALVQMVTVLLDHYLQGIEINSEGVLIDKFGEVFVEHLHIGHLHMCREAALMRCNYNMSEQT